MQRFDFKFDVADEAREILGLTEEEAQNSKKVHTAYLIKSREYHPDKIRHEKNESNTAFELRRQNNQIMLAKVKEAEETLSKTPPIIITINNSVFYKGEQKDLSSFLTNQPKDFNDKLWQALNEKAGASSEDEMLQDKYINLANTVRSVISNQYQQQVKDEKVREDQAREERLARQAPFEKIIFNLNRLLPRDWKDYTETYLDVAKLITDVSKRAAKKGADDPGVKKEFAMIELNIKINDLRNKLASNSIDFDAAKQVLKTAVNDAIDASEKKQESGKFGKKHTVFGVTFQITKSDVTQSLTKFLNTQFKEPEKETTYTPSTPTRGRSGSS